MVLIFIGSTDLLSGEHTSRFIGPFLRWFSPGVSETTIASIQLVVRKCGHLAEYAILAALLCRAMRHSSQRWFAAWGIAAVYASLDELHQSFVSSRTGTPWDVSIDCVGALVGVLIYRLMSNRKSKMTGLKVASCKGSSRAAL